MASMSDCTLVPVLPHFLLQVAQQLEWQLTTLYRMTDSADM